MRRLIIAATAVAALATTGLAGTSAQAMPLSGLSDQATSSIIPAYTKCKWVWEYGYRVQRCWEVYDAPRYYAPPRQSYYGGYGYGGGYRGGY